MTKSLAWALFILGVLHLVFGVVRFKLPLSEAVAEGFIGRFAASDARRTAFWFLMCGPFLMLAGHLAVNAVSQGNLEVMRLIGYYLLAGSLVGVAAFPVSPLWAPLLLAPLLIAAGHGLLR